MCTCEQFPQGRNHCFPVQEAGGSKFGYKQVFCPGKAWSLSLQDSAYGYIRFSHGRTQKGKGAASLRRHKDNTLLLSVVP